MKNNELMVTSPRLASELIKVCPNYEMIPNPYRSDWSAWLFPITPEVRAVAVEYYESNCKRLPRCLLERKGENESEQG